VAIALPGEEKYLLALPVSTLFQWRCTTGSFQLRYYSSSDCTKHI